MSGMPCTFPVMVCYIGVVFYIQFENVKQKVIKLVQLHLMDILYQHNYSVF